MLAHDIKRMPVSCENCRRRKIRCHGRQVPCDTCVRRGRASSCRYLKDEDILLKGDHQDNYVLLLERISRLEDLLKQQIAVSTDVLAQQRLGIPGATLLTPTAATEPADAGQSRGRLLPISPEHIRYAPFDGFAQSPHELLSQGIVHSAHTSPCIPTDFPFSPDTAASRQQLLDLLPPMGQCDSLKQIFFDVFAPLFHVLHDPTFEDYYTKFRDEAGQVPLSFLSLVFVILAIATTALSSDDPLLKDLGHEANTASKLRRITSKYQSAAMRCLSADQFLWQQNLNTLQTLLLLVYSLSHTNGPAWSLLGATFNIAVSLGCHVDPSELAGVNVVEAEERRRCWAALMMLHTIQNTCLGNIAPIRITSNVRLPADIDDDDLLYDTSPCDRMSPSRTPSKMAYILHKFKLYQLAADICQLPLPSSSSPGSTLIESLDRQVAAQEDAQLTKFADLSHLPTYHQAHHYILSTYTNQLFLILHRPCLSAPATIDPRGHTKLTASLRRCISAAAKILHNHESLCSIPAFGPYRWYIDGLGAFYALLAASTLIVAASHPAALLSSDDNGEDNSTIPADAVIALLQTCIFRFRESANRSDLCARGLLVLERALVSSSKSPTQANIDINSSSRTTSDTPDTASTAATPAYALSGSTIGALTHSSHADADAIHHRSQNFAHSLPQISPLTSNNDSDNAHSPSRASVDLDGWQAHPQLMGFVTYAPHQQWLAPANFAWETWFPVEAQQQQMFSSGDIGNMALSECVSGRVGMMGLVAAGGGMQLPVEAMGMGLV
jgi:Fungal specific transcription factor domain/Fungal Zn(2)-Cys(6) binuclear cluster domain